MNKAFNLWSWENEPSAETPLSAEFLNRLNNGLNEVDNRVVNHNSTKLDVTTANSMVQDVTFDSASGVFTITKLNGSTTKIDTKLEKIAVNFEYDSSTQTLKIILEDGTTQTVDLSALITQYEFDESDTIVLTVGTNGKVMAKIKYGSITANMLEPNYLANVTAQADDARMSADRASAEADRAEEAADRAEQIAGGDFATNGKVDAIIDGTTTVGNADKLDGHDSDYFAPLEELDNHIYPIVRIASDDDLSQLDDLHTNAKNDECYERRLYFSYANAFFSGGVVMLEGCRQTATHGYQIAKKWGNIVAIRSIVGGTWGEWIKFATTTDLANYLPLKSGKLLSVSDYIGGRVAFQKPTQGQTLNGELVQDLQYQDRLRFYESGGNNRGAFIDINKCANSIASEILHTGNKPSGTYTGNGDATARTITTNGLGHAVLVTGNNHSMIVMPNGADGVKSSGDSVSLGWSASRFINGTMTLATDNVALNASGVTYDYQVL